MMKAFDVGIKNARIINGTGNRYFLGDVGILDGKIVKVGFVNQEHCERSIDAEGKILSPGFIDIHSHSDIFVLHDPTMKLKLAQGITTEISGNCGLSAAPVSSKHFKEKKQYFQGINIGITPPPNWSSFTSFEIYMKEVQKVKPATNMAFLVGHGDIRIAVMGFENRKASPEEMTKMKVLVEEAMKSGAVGMSSGLLYAPGIYTDMSEIVKLCKVVDSYGGIYTSHIRDELSGVVDSVEEAIHVGRLSGVPVVISHHKIGGSENWGKSRETLKLIDQANEEGIQVSLDMYPYEASCTYVSINIPPKYHESGLEGLLSQLRDDETWRRIRSDMLGEECVGNVVGFNNVLVIAADNTKEVIGETISSISLERNEDPVDTIRWLLIENNGNVMAANFAFDEQDIIRIMKHPYSMIASDGLQTGGGVKTHPRTTATFTRYLGKYIRDGKVLNWEEAIRKITSLPAQIIGLKNKGLILEGYDADLVLLDPGEIMDQATFLDPYADNKGIEIVMVNGEIVYEKGRFSPNRYGKVIKIGEHDGSIKKGR